MTNEITLHDITLINSQPIIWLRQDTFYATNHEVSTDRRKKLRTSAAVF